MTDLPISRRRLLQGMAAGAGLVVAAGCTPPPFRFPPPGNRHHPIRPPGSRPDPRKPEGADLLPKVEHIVIYMQENHSYDNYFGLLRRGDGLRLGRDGTPRNTNPDLQGKPVGDVPSRQHLRHPRGREPVVERQPHLVRRWADGRLRARRRRRHREHGLLRPGRHPVLLRPGARRSRSATGGSVPRSPRRSRTGVTCRRRPPSASSRPTFWKCSPPRPRPTGSSGSGSTRTASPGTTTQSTSPTSSCSRPSRHRTAVTSRSSTTSSPTVRRARCRR